MTSQVQKTSRLLQNLCRRNAYSSPHLCNYSQQTLNSPSAVAVIRAILVPHQCKYVSSSAVSVVRDDLTHSHDIILPSIKVNGIMDKKDNGGGGGEIKCKNEAIFRVKTKLDKLDKTFLVAKQAKDMAVDLGMKFDPKHGYQIISKLMKEDIFQTRDDVFQDWLKEERELADGLSKTIKYAAKIRNDDYAKLSEILLSDMLSRHVDSIEKQTAFKIGKHHKTLFSDEDVDELMNLIEKDFETFAQPKVMELSKTRFGIPVPDTKDFTNVLHAWASSKVRKKGIYAENILYRMMELAYLYPENFSMPGSKTFGLVVKCHAGSTLKDALSRIEKLHKIHNRLAEMGYPGIVPNDPFLLMHSIKSVTSITTEREYKVVEEWFDRLHSHVMQPPSIEIESNFLQSSSESTSKEQIDLTSTYSTIIRCYSKMQWGNDCEAPQKTFDALERMISFAKRCKESDSWPVATVQLKVNPFNLFLGISTAGTNDATIIDKKLSVLNTMIQAAEEDSNDDSSSATDSFIPLPNDQSFASCIKAVSSLKDTHRAIREAEGLLDIFESLSLQKQPHIVEPSTKVYNALIDLYIHLSGRDKNLAQNLPSICDDICNRIERHSPSLELDAMTYTLLLKSCTIGNGNVHHKEQKLQRARGIFEKVSQSNRKGSPMLNDKCYFYMMKCVAQNMTHDPEEKKKQIMELFSQACKGGFVSSDVLKSLRINTTDEEYKRIVGDGRLADAWIANVTSGVALYTDGTTGGAGKNARRKGKSTSDWAKKQRRKEEEIRNKKIAKAEKKRSKKAWMTSNK